MVKSRKRMGLGIALAVLSVGAFATGLATDHLPLPSVLAATTKPSASALAPPSIVREPNNPTDDKVAKFKLAHADKQVSFRCALVKDSTLAPSAAAFSSCNTNPRYTGLVPASYCFWAVAVKGGQTSATASSCWDNFDKKTFGITSNTSGLSPGVAKPIDLVLSNPNSVAIKILSVTVAVQTGTSKPGCAGSNFEITKQLTGDVTVPAGVTRSLTQLGVSQAQWPVLRMKNLTTNQDACKNTTFTLTYTGSATK